VSFRWILGVSLVVLVWVVMAGCGGGSETSEMTKADFVKSANAVCANQREEWRSTLKSLAKKSAESKGGQAGFTAVRKRSEAAFESTLLPALKKELEGLEELQVPQSDDAEVEAILRSLSSGINDLEQQGSEGLLNAKNFAGFEKKSEAYGLDCGFLV
jgi:hypothetical protein